MGPNPMTGVLVRKKTETHTGRRTSCEDTDVVGGQPREDEGRDGSFAA